MMAPDTPEVTPQGNLPAEFPVRSAGLAEDSLKPLPSPWSLSDLGYFVAFAALWLLMSSVLTTGGYAVLKPLMGWHTPLHALQNNAYFALVSQMVFYGPVLAYVYYLVVVRYRLRFLRGVNWRTPTARQAAWYFAGGIFLGVAIQFTPTVLPDKESFPLQELFSSPGAAYAVAIFAVLMAPLVEELIFRGVLFSFFERLVGLRFAMVSTTLLFGGLHVPEYWGAWNRLLLVSLAGGVFSLTRGVTDSLAPSVVLHLAYNASLMIALFFETHHFQSFGIFVY